MRGAKFVYRCACGDFQKYVSWTTQNAWPKGVRPNLRNPQAMRTSLILAATACLFAANPNPLMAADTQRALPAVQQAQNAMYIRTSPLVIDYTHAVLPAGGTAGAAAPMSAAPREYQFTVPVTIVPPPSTPAMALRQAANVGSLPVTVTCAVGPASLTFAAGKAVNSFSSGFATVQMQRSHNAYTSDVSVTVTAPDANKRVNAYMCSSVVNPSTAISSPTTPLNYVVGKIATSATPSTSTADDFNSPGQ